MNDTPQNALDVWTIDEASTWPPRGKPARPFGPTMLEVVRSCPLRGCFERSSGYERRMSFDGRIGTAFHRALQSLIEHPPHRETSIPEEAQRRFNAELQVQEARADERPRERGLPRDHVRTTRAVEALVSLAQRLALPTPVQGPLPPARRVAAPCGYDHNSVEQGNGVELEVAVASADGLFTGRIDRAEHTDSGTRIIDYKSALRDDLPDRYVRQVQLYALLWQQTRGEWPSTAEVVYPLTGLTYNVVIDPATCEAIGAESAALVRRIEGERSLATLGTPGDVCHACEFRPWCRPFWSAQARVQPASLMIENARWGFEGTIAAIVSNGDHLKVQITWRDAVAELVVPVDRFPQLRTAEVGTRLRVLDTRLYGVRHRPRVKLTEWSEVFLVMPRTASGP